MEGVENILEIAHKKYVDWWLPIDLACDSCLAPMSFNRFCEALLTREENTFWDRWMPNECIVDSRKKYCVKLYILKRIKKCAMN